MTKLTRKQIDAMEAGREMDALMAELVMGLDITPRPEHTWRKLDVDERDSYQSVYVCEVCNYVPGWIWKDELEKYETTQICNPAYPFYSTDIAAAFQALETFDRVEWDIEIISDTEDEGKFWDVTLNKYTEESVGIVATGSAAGTELPYALSKAMIKAVTSSLTPFLIIQSGQVAW